MGGSPTTTTGATYLPIVEAAFYEPAPIRIDINSFDPVSGDIQTTVTMYSETDTFAGDHIHFLLLEDNLTSEHTHATRDIINDTITLAGAGNTAVFNKSFDVDPGWNVANLHAVVFVQRAADKEVLQAVSTYDEPDYGLRAVVPTGRMQFGPSSGAFSGEPFAVVNTGLADTFTIELVIDQAPPAGWTVSYSDDQGVNHTDPWSFSLGLEESTEFSVQVTPTSPGYMKFHLEISSPNLTTPLIIPFTRLTDDVDVLIVDDDGARVVYLGFGYEAIDNPQDRADMLGRSLLWLGVNKLFVDGFESGDTSMWSVAVP